MLQSLKIVPIGMELFWLIDDYGKMECQNRNFSWDLKTRDILELENWDDSY